MKLIFIDQRHGQSRSLELKGWLRALLSLCLLGTPVGLGYFGYQLAAGQGQNPLVFNQQSAENWQKELEIQAEQLEQLRVVSEHELDAMTLKLAKLQALQDQFATLGKPLEIFSVDTEMSLRLDLWRPGEAVDLLAAPYNLRVQTERVDPADHPMNKWGEDLGCQGSGVPGCAPWRRK